MQLFDTKKELEVPIVSGTTKRCLVRWPTDAEWCERNRRQTVVRRSLGRDSFQTQATNVVEANADLFGQIRIVKEEQPELNQPFDEAEASAVIDRMERCEILSVERNGDQFQIRARVPKAEVLHVLRMPKQQEVMDYNRACVQVSERRRQQEYRALLEPGGAFYDAVAVRQEGYANGIPINHKDAIVRELLVEFSTAAEEADPEL